MITSITHRADLPSPRKTHEFTQQAWRAKML